MTTTYFGEVPVQVTSADQAVDDLLSHAVSNEPPTTYRLINAYTVALASRDDDYRENLCGPGVNLPDGRPLARVLSFTHRSGGVEQVRGPSLFEDCLDRGRSAGVRHYLLGGTAHTLKKLTQQIQLRFPGVLIVGAESPPFRTLTHNERAAQAERIRASGAHVVWVALGTPKQDFEAVRVMQETGVTTAAVGAAFDFTAATIPQAPGWMRRSGLEWLFRLATEPRRLWGRYLFGNARFLWLTAQHLTRHSRATWARR